MLFARRASTMRCLAAFRSLATAARRCLMPSATCAFGASRSVFFADLRRSRIVSSAALCSAGSVEAPNGPDPGRLHQSRGRQLDAPRTKFFGSLRSLGGRLLNLALLLSFLAWICGAHSPGATTRREEDAPPTRGPRVQHAAPVASRSSSSSPLDHAVRMRSPANHTLPPFKRSRRLRACTAVLSACTRGRPGGRS